MRVAKDGTAVRNTVHERGVDLRAGLRCQNQQNAGLDVLIGSTGKRAGLKKTQTSIHMVHITLTASFSLTLPRAVKQLNAAETTR